VPDTTLGLLLFVICFAPGLAFFFIRDRRRPSRDLSTLRETGAILLVGLICDLITVGLLAILRAALPHHTPRIGSIVRDPRPYLEANLAYVLWWGFGLLAVAVAAGVGLAFLTTRGGGEVIYESAWYRALHYYPDEDLYVGCALNDGSWVEGFVGWFNDDVEESENRDLMLVAPIMYRPAGGEELRLRPGVMATIVAARRLVFLEVSHLPKGELARQRKLFDQQMGSGQAG
jgi:Family of unknown function (DUF6338)